MSYIIATNYDSPQHAYSIAIPIIIMHYSPLVGHACMQYPRKWNMEK